MRETFDTPGPVTVALDVARSDIEVTVVDGHKTEVEITGYDKDEAPRVACDPMPDGSYRVSVEHKPKKFWGMRLFGGGVDITLTVPQGTTIDGAGGAADLDAHGTLAALSFRSGAGDLRFDDVSGDISIGRLDGTSMITVGSGDIEIRQVGPGSVDARAISGDVHVGVREGLGVWLDVSSRSGDVRSTLEATRRSDAEEPDLPQLELTLNTVSGDIDVTRVSASGR